MSVTESKAKNSKKSSANAAKSVMTDDMQRALEQTPITYMPLSALVKSPLNVRTIPYSAESVSGLAETIFTLGLLQNLVVHAMPEGIYGVAAGGRRLSAIQLLVERGSYLPEQTVAVKVVAEELARAVSLAENSNRQDMHPAEQIVSFRGMAEEGKTAAQIGAQQGFSPRHVQRMLKLAGLAPSILEALAKDELTTEHCHALALEDDQARQVEVLDAARKLSGSTKPELYRIRNLITDSEVSTSCARFRFVGENAFKEGEIRRDLFSDAEGGYVNSALLDIRVDQKLQALADFIQKDEGWAWALGRTAKIWHRGEDANLYDAEPEPKPEPEYTEEESERAAALHNMLDADVNAEGEALSDEESGRMFDELQAIESAAENRAYSPERKAGQGVVVSLDEYSGGVCIQRGVMRLEPKNEEDQGEGATHNKAGSRIITFEREVDPIDEISLPLVTKMSSERTLCVQAALMQNTPTAVALLAWKLCKSAFAFGGYSDNPLQVRLDCSLSALSREAPSGKEGAAYLALMQEQERLAALLPEGWEKDFTTFFTLDAKTLMALMGYCTAVGIDGVQTREHNRTSSSRLDKLETALDFNMRDWWQPTKDNFFGLLSKAQIVSVLNEVGATGVARDAEKMKKGDAAERAEDIMAGNRWVPVWLQGPKPKAEAETTETDAAQDADTPNTVNAA
ncbi:ParB/RepB/Spo0J family partition protein [Ewingella americana]|uniref:ParB/RepB/Spo0J family partition protein n=1 Tax=Ewingella americana TaxID=41202 RepID=UPI00163AF17A|nr:ParB/RepB/Spo0J family partition protein [Ewingella americana]QMV54158.1 ParB/RepB/Spo0J family partition protein [Ewingella americana]